MVDSDLCFFMDHMDELIDDRVNQPADNSACFLIDDSSQSFQFTTSRQKEINGLLEKGVFELASERDVPPGTRVFNARFVDEIRNEGTEQAYEKSRLVVQAYNDSEKDQILTQSPTIQRMNQRLILCIAAMMGSDSIKLYLRDITQAYVQSTFIFNRDFYVRPPHELATAMRASPDCILKIMRPLYGVPEVGNH